ncbi:MAG: 50S ribosomal protein L11 methyltransferase, partial [Bacteroidales bacterium]
MAYREVIIKIVGDLSAGRDITIAQLSEEGFESFEETPVGLNAYIPDSKYDEKSLLSLTVLMSNEFKGSGYTSSRIETINWNEEWEKNYDPVEVGDFCYIRAMFHPPEGKFKHEIIIQPKMSFGTGHHSTTWLMINAM